MQMIKLFKIFSIALLCSLWSSLLFADPLGEAELALNTGDYQTAYRLFNELAEKNEPGAMIGLGRMYQDGLGVQKNRDTAIEWFGKGVTIWNQRAKEGDPRAYASLGVLFNKGIGFQQDKSRAQRYFRTAFDMAQPKALEGDHDAQHLIGMLYSSGKGVNKDIYAGADWLAKAGEGGNETAAKMLLHIYECGCRGLPKDQARADYWRAKIAAARQ